LLSHAAEERTVLIEARPVLREASWGAAPDAAVVRSTLAPSRQKGKAKQRPSFLKKSKKLSSIAAGMELKLANSVQSETDKSFLVLFFQKRTSRFPSFSMG
jgi:hypothetical protein